MESSSIIEASERGLGYFDNFELKNNESQIEMVDTNMKLYMKTNGDIEIPPSNAGCRATEKSRDVLSSQKEFIFVDTDIKVAGEVLSPGIKPYIEKLFDKTSCPKERGQALELLTSLALGDHLRPNRSSNIYNHPRERHILRQRPKTAMAMLEGRKDPAYMSSSIFNPYETSYTAHYPTRPMTSAKAERPSTAVNSFVPRHPLAGAVGSTTYGEEFRNKSTIKAEPIRTGTSSGNRNNNPHPLKEFMVWRYPRSNASTSTDVKENMDLEMQMAVTGEEFDRVIRGKCRSVYQSDFTGLPQGADVSPNFADLPEDPMSRIKYSKDSTNRTIHAPPSPLPTELRVPTTRFGSKRDRLPAYGTLPGVVSATQMHIQNRTTYDRDVNDRANKLYGQLNDIRRMGRHQTEDALKKCMTMVNGREKTSMQRMLDEVRHTSADSGTPACVRSVTAGGSMEGRVNTPSWVSRWAGPT